MNLNITGESILAAARQSAIDADPKTWPLHVDNVYGETRAAALARAEAAVKDARTAVNECEAGDYCFGREEFEQAKQDADMIRHGGRDEFSLDGVAAHSWTILADSVEYVAGTVEHTHTCHG